MKFKKMLLLGINDSDLDKTYLSRLDELADKKIILDKDSDLLEKEITDADCLLIKWVPEINASIMEKAKKLKYIGILATAYGHVDMAYAKKCNVIVCNVPGYSTESVSEFVFASLLEYLRELERAKNQVRKGNYSEAGFTASEISGKNFAIIGAGRIGKRVAEIALGFGANVIYWSRNRKADLEERGVKYDEIDSLLKKADFISFHASRTKETENFFDKERISKIKKGAVLLITVPMQVVDIEALEGRIKANEITFITDHSDEMKEEDVKRFVGYKNVIMYPSIAYISKEGRIAKQEIFIGNIENFLKGSPTNVVK